MTSVVTGLTECLNCAAPLSGPFCAGCGQKAAPPDPTFHQFLHELTHETLHVDGRVFRSMRLLFTRPGFLTRELLHGRRASYLTPMRLYLIFSVLYFVLAMYAPLEVTSRIDPQKGRVVMTGGITLSGDIVEGRTDLEVAGLVRDLQHKWTPRLMFVMVPVFGAFVMLGSRRRPTRFPRHLYFAIHTHAAWFGILSLGMAIRFTRLPLANEAAGLLTVAAILGYTAIAIRTVYGSGWLRSTWRAVVTLFAYVSVLVLATVLLFIADYTFFGQN